MAEEFVSIIFFFIIIGSPFCDAQKCEVSKTGHICKNIVNQFPGIPYKTGSLQCLDCQIQNFDKETFPYENTLRSFNLSHSGLQHIGEFGFSNLKRLLRLYLQNNDIKSISENAFAGLSELMELHLGENRLETLQPGFLNGITSRLVNISKNILNSLPAEAFRGSTSLFILDLSHNKMNRLDKDTFINLEYIHYLDLSFNLLCHVPLGTFRSLKLLKELNLGKNKFSFLDKGALSGLRNLDFVDLSRNSLTFFDPVVLLPMLHLRRLDISGNGIYYFDANDILLNVPSLKEISFGDNIFSCMQLKNALQFFKSKSIDVDVSDLRYEYKSINGIACLDYYSNTDDDNGSIFVGRMSLDNFLETSKKEQDFSVPSCEFV